MIYLIVCLLVSAAVVCCIVIDARRRKRAFTKKVDTIIGDVNKKSRRNYVAFTPTSMSEFSSDDDDDTLLAAAEDVDEIVETLRRKREAKDAEALNAAAEQYQQLRNDPVAWEEELKERAVWDQTLGDGRESESSEPSSDSSGSDD